MSLETMLCSTSRAISDDHPEEVQKTVDTLSSNLTSVYDAHRVTVVSFYSEVDGVVYISYVACYGK